MEDLEGIFNLQEEILKTQNEMFPNTQAPTIVDPVKFAIGMQSTLRVICRRIKRDLQLTK